VKNAYERSRVCSVRNPKANENKNKTPDAVSPRDPYNSGYDFTRKDNTILSWGRISADTAKVRTFAGGARGKYVETQAVRCCKDGKKSKK